MDKSKSKAARKTPPRSGQRRAKADTGLQVQSASIAAEWSANGFKVTVAFSGKRFRSLRKWGIALALIAVVAIPGLKPLIEQAKDALKTLSYVHAGK